VEKSKRHVIEGWMDKAWNRLSAAREHVKGGVHYSGAVQDAQECVELSVKAILTLLNVEFQKKHGWDKENLAKIADQIQKNKLLDGLADKHLYIRLPRLIFLANFWDQFYLTAKYGMEAGYLASAQDLFGRAEADLAVTHAHECYNAAHQLRYLPEDQLAALIR
jgi:HEPN domain-containing protein